MLHVYKIRICLDYYGAKPTNYCTVNIVASCVGSAIRFLFNSYSDIYSYEIISEEVVHLSDI